MSSPHLARVVEEAEARQLPALIDEWWDAHDVRRWLARSLRIDLALLTERPELVVPCLYRRCAWMGGPAEAAFYAERPEVPRDAAALRELVGPWRPGRPWLRALRPPQVPLDGGMIEEYRTSLSGELRISNDAETIAVVGEDGAAAWDRLTGRRVEGARALLPARGPAQRWRLRRGSSGRSVLETDDSEVELEIEYHDGPGGPDSTRQLDDVLVIVSGRGLHHLVDVRTGRVVWAEKGDVESAVLSPDGERLFRACHGTIEIAALATGETLAWWPVRGVRQLVLASDGTLATYSAGVVRVWDPSMAARARTQLFGDMEGPMQFSPDGTRLVTDGLLCDARTGAAIGAMDHDGSLGHHRLTDDGYVMIWPLGLRLWDSRDGSLIREDPECRASFLDAAAIDPAGGRLALSLRGEQPLLVLALHSGELVLERDGVRIAKREDDSFAIGFSPDGEQLWWEDQGGARWVLPMSAPDLARRLADDEPTPREPDPVTVEVRDGLLVAGGAAIPCDDEAAVISPDGRTFASRTSHYALEDG